MKKNSCLMSIGALVAACLFAGPAAAASDCLQLQLDAPAPLCAGQPGSLTATVTNSCASRERVQAGFTLDEQALPAKASFTVAGDATLSKTFTIPVPASATTGTHSLTVTLTDRSGDTATASVDLDVASCSAP